MKKLITLLAILIAPALCLGAQKTVSVGTSGSKKSLDTNFGNTQDNFTELYGWVDQSVKTTANPAFNSVNLSSGNVAAANVQVVKEWKTGLPYTADATAVIQSGMLYICKETHTAGTFATDLAANKWTLWGGAYTLDTNIITGVSASDDTIPSAKAVGAALDLKAPIANPTFTTEVTSPAFISNAADGAHYLSATNTVAITAANTLGNVAWLTDRFWMGNGTNWTTRYLLDSVSTLGAGYTAGAGTVSTSDTYMAAIQKLDGNIAAKAPSTSAQLTTPVIVDGSTLTFDESAADPNDADVALSAADGVFKIAAVNGANNEDITIDLDAASNKATVASSTGVTGIQFNMAVQGRMIFNTYSGDQTLTAAAHNASIVQFTAPAEATLWDCETANVGDWVAIWVKDAGEATGINPASGDAIILLDGTSAGADHEVDINVTAAGTKVTLVCTADDTWSIYSETATSTDSGAQD